jgi:hypothetical protein
MKFLEKDLEQIIYTADKTELENRGLPIFGKLKRQVRIGNYGVADLIEYSKPSFIQPWGRHEKGNITIYELKQEKISVSAFFQAIRYVKGILRYLEKCKNDSKHHYNYNIVLIGRSICFDSSACYLSDIFPAGHGDIDAFSHYSVSISLYTYEYDVDGIKFKEVSGYKLTNEGF